MSVKKKIYWFIIFAFLLIIFHLSFYKYFYAYKLEKIETESIIDSFPQIEIQRHPNKVYHYTTPNDYNILGIKKNKKTIKEKQNNEKDVDCVISIPDIDLLKKVYTGNKREKHLDNYELITATSDMKYSNGGNYIICGHASRLYGHSLNRLSEVLEYTQIQIWANNEVENYVVKEVKYVNMKETSKYCNQTKNKQITILSCAKNVSPDSYIVVIAIPK
ncbi:MAG: sortase [Lachnospiraceae bacterium]|nr:sortase [Lachnospiraceae bacterium]